MAKEKESDKKEKKKNNDAGDSETVKNPEVKDKVKVEFEPSMRDFWSSMDESFDKLANGDEDALNEVMSVSARIKRRQQMRRYKSRMQIARKRSLKRRASNAVIARRARRSAVNAVKKRFAGGRDSSKLTYADRARVEKLAARRKALITRRARRLVIAKRALDRNRLAGRGRR